MSCIKKFSKTEMLEKGNKFYCSYCDCLQEATKRFLFIIILLLYLTSNYNSMKIKKLPKILIFQLKRFKYSEELGAYKKISYRVPFPFEIKLNATVTFF